MTFTDHAMELPLPSSLRDLVGEWEQSAAVGLGVLLLVLVVLLWLIGRATTRWIRSCEVTADDALTVVAAILAGAFSAQGMWGFFRSTLHLPMVLTIIGFTMFEVVQVAVALRARRNVLSANGRSGPEGTALWLFAVLAGFFSASHAKSAPEAFFRFILPSVAAWLWHRKMGLERQQFKLTDKLGGINWRISPERILIRLGLADPTDRTAAEVSAERTLMTLAIAARAASTAPRSWGCGKRARKRLDSALQRAVEFGRLGTDPASELLLVNTLGVLNGADSLMTLQPPPPWTTTAATAGLEDTYRDLIGAGMVEVNDQTKAALGLSATGPQPARPGWAASTLKPVEPLPINAPVLPAPNRRFNQATDDTTAGQDADLDLTATMRATILSAKAKGVGEQKIADELGISRHRVRKFLADQPVDPDPAPTTVNGHAHTADTA